MRKIWLEWYAERLMNHVNPGRIERGKNPYRSHEEAFRDIVQRARAVVRRNLDVDDHLFFMSKLAPFAGMESGKPYLGVRVPTAPRYDVFDELLYHGGDIDRHAEEIIRNHSAIYLDFADRVFMMPGGVFQVRALFVWNDNGAIRFYAVLTRPGSEKGWIFAWQQGRHARDPKDSRFDEVWAPVINEIADRNREINRKKIDYAAFADLEKLALMSIANWEMFKENAAPVLPNFDRDRASRGRKVMVHEGTCDAFIQEEPASSSIFKVTVLPALDEDRIQQIRNRFSGLQYRPRTRKNCEHMVDGFYRMQPFGPGRKFRRKVWIAGHKRGAGAPKPVMYSLPRNNRVAV